MLFSLLALQTLHLNILPLVFLILSMRSRFFLVIHTIKCWKQFSRCYYGKFNTLRETKDYSEKKLETIVRHLNYWFLRHFLQPGKGNIVHLCNEYVLCLERFDEREQSITRNVIWIVMQKKNDKSYWYKKGKKKRNRNRKQCFSKKHDY